MSTIDNSLSGGKPPNFCDTCFAANFIQIVKGVYRKPCQLCDRPLTVFQICRGCSVKLNACQVCLLQIEGGVPVSDGDEELAEETQPRPYVPGPITLKATLRNCHALFSNIKKHSYRVEGRVKKPAPKLKPRRLLYPGSVRIQSTEVTSTSSK